MDFFHIGYEIVVENYRGVNKLKLARKDWVKGNYYYSLILL